MLLFPPRIYFVLALLFFLWNQQTNNSPVFLYILQDQLENVQAQLSFQEERLRETTEELTQTREQLKLKTDNVLVSLASRGGSHDETFFYNLRLHGCWI